MAADLQAPVLGSLVTNPVPGASVATPAAPQNVPSSNLAPKRHRRPSVRLGDIGDQPATLRTSKPWRLNPHEHKSSKTRPLTNLVNPTPNPGNGNGKLENSSADTNNNGNRKYPNPKEFKSKRSTTSFANSVNTTSSKRVRTNFWIDQQQQTDNLEERENEFDEDNTNINSEEGFRDFDPDIDDEEQSPLNSADKDNDDAHLHNDNDNDVELLHDHVDMWHAHNRRSIRVSNSDSRNNNNNRGGTGLEDGVRKWLDELGLPRYAPLFEFHEVDEQVLPFLTLDDLKDMGIFAVGSRRKLFTAILKLRKALS